jgi:LPXTG-motif cell wall-anchored protein
MPVMSTAPVTTATPAASGMMTMSTSIVKPPVSHFMTPAMAAAAAAATAAASSQTSQTVNTSDPVAPAADVPGADVSNPVQFVPVMPIVSAAPSIWKNPYFWLAVGGGVVVAGTGIYLIRRRRKS